MLRKLTIVNAGKFNFDYTWELDGDLKVVSIDPTSGGIKLGASSACQLAFCAQKSGPIKGHDLRLKVS